MPIDEKLTVPTVGWTAWCQGARSLPPKPKGATAFEVPARKTSPQDKAHASH